MEYGILVSQLGILWLEGGFLTSGPPAKSPIHILTNGLEALKYEMQMDK